MAKRMLVFLVVLALMALGCNLGSSGASSPPPPAIVVPQGGGEEPTATPAPVGTPPADPVSMNEGLGSLNSYQMTILFKTIGPDPSQSSTTTIDTQRSTETKATYTHLNMVTVPKGGGEPDSTDSHIYNIGNDQCSSNGDKWDWTSSTPAEAEIANLLKSMIGMTPLIENPTFIGEEAVNGIPTNHFSFNVSGLGVESGAQVSINQGNYWLAVDGQYLVKYLLIIETSSDPTTVLHEEVSIELTQINQPISISFPQGCLDASLVTPEP